MANRPRWIRKNTAYCEVQRTVDRQFFFKPDETTRNIIGAAAGRALKKYPINGLRKNGMDFICSSIAKCIKEKSWGTPTKMVTSASFIIAPNSSGLNPEGGNVTVAPIKSGKISEIIQGYV